MGRIVQHHENILNPLPVQSKCVAGYQTQIATPITNQPQQPQLRAWDVNKFSFSQKSEQNLSVCIFPLQYFCCYSRSQASHI